MKDWNLEDYPIELSRNENALEEHARYTARITGCLGMFGFGDTEEKALEDLRERFTAFKSRNALPEPGAEMPLPFASTSKIGDYEDIAIDFFRKILGLNYHECFVSDMSSLADFDPAGQDISSDDFKSKVVQAVYDAYGVEISEAYDGYLINVFEKIRNARKGAID